MTLATWPTELRKPTRSGYQAQRQDTRLAKRNGGTPGYRRRFSSGAKQVAMTINMSRSEKAVFDHFYDTVTGAGSLPFTMPDPVTDGWTLLTADGAPLLTDQAHPIVMAAQWLCLFGEDSPVETIVGVRFNISFSVWIMP